MGFMLQCLEAGYGGAVYDSIWLSIQKVSVGLAVLVDIVHQMHVCLVGA